MSDDKDGEAINAKLIAAKEKWARERRLITGQTDEAHVHRLPPGQRQVTNWPVLDLGLMPDVSKGDWRMTVDGLVENPVVLNFEQLLALPQTESVSDIHCVTKWSRFDNLWNGVATRDLIALVRPKAEARHVVFHALDGYTTNVAFEVFAAEDAIVAHMWEGYPITRQHGGPVRIVIPRYYFWKSAKWVKRIEFCRDDRPGFWEERGYHNEGDPWLEERYGPQD
ncbi:MAG: sulfite oxidase-like oxidoreductase [Micropepsaceae bacterium]